MKKACFSVVLITLLFMGCDGKSVEDKNKHIEQLVEKLASECKGEAKATVYVSVLYNSMTVSCTESREDRENAKRK